MPRPRRQPAPPPTATPTPLTSFASKLQRLQRKTLRSLGMSQRRFAERIPEPRVGALPPGEAGLSDLPPSSPITSLVQRGFHAIRGVPKVPKVRPPGTRTIISPRAPNPEAAVRHEAAHHLLQAQGIPREQQIATDSPGHRIIRRGRVPGTTRGVDFRLLERARQAEVTGTAEQEARASRAIQQSARGQRRRTVQEEARSRLTSETRPAATRPPPRSEPTAPRRAPERVRDLIERKFRERPGRRRR